MSSSEESQRLPVHEESSIPSPFSIVASPENSPAKLIRIYGRTYREASSSSDFSHGTSDRNESVIGDYNDHLASDSTLGEATNTSSESDESSFDESCSDDSSSLDNSNSEISSDSASARGNSSSSQTSSSSDRSCDSDSAESEDEIFCAQKLFSGSEKTTDEAVLALMDLFIRKRWKVTTLKEVLKYCHNFFPNNMPKTIYRLFKYVESLDLDSYCEVCHYYCGDCLTRKGGKDGPCNECGSKSTGVFYELPLSFQIKHLFEQRNLASLIESYKRDTHNDQNISDITSGKGCQELKNTLKGKYDLTLLFNTDGVSPVHSSEAHLYPILATICEIPPKLRPSYMLVCGIWYDVKFAPIMNDFFSPFVTALKKIYKDGVRWTHPATKEEVMSVVAAPVLSADALGRADLLVMQHHNGKRGCNNCEQKTKRFRPSNGGRKIRRYLYQENAAKLRDKDRMKRQGLRAAEGTPVKGVVGDSVISEIPHFDRGKSAPPEYMHCVLLGVVKYFVNLWLFTPGNWNIKDRMNVIDTFIMKNVKVTDEFVRVPKKLKDLKLWKASDLRVWLLFISLPALHGHLKDKYFQHWLLLVSAIYVLLKQEITSREITMAEAKLRLFVRDIAKLYRLEDYTYNVHNLLHLAQHVKRWGPLWATSAFPFENFNHVLGELAHGPKHKGKQIVNKIKLANGLEILRNKVTQNQRVSARKAAVVLGLPVRIELDRIDFDLPCDTEGYVRANVKGEIFTTKLYDRKMVRTNSIVCFKTGQSIAYGQLLYFFENDSEVKCLIEKLTVEQRQIFTNIEGNFSVLHLLPVFYSGTVICASVEALMTKHAKVGHFLCIRPNVIEKNL